MAGQKPWRASRVWFCVEYAGEGFKPLAAHTGLGYSYGTTIMGMSVAEGAVSKYLRKNPLDKRTLAKSLESEAVRCWWLCDADFDGMTIWHKDYEGAELAGYLEAIADAADGRG